jgi:hypothetical protein
MEFADTARAASRVRRRPRLFRKELGQTRPLHDILLTRKWVSSSTAHDEFG